MIRSIMKIGILVQNLWIHLLGVLNAISAIVIFLIAPVITADVVGRFAFNKPIPGVTELVKSALAAIVFLALAYALQQGRHVRATVFLHRLSPIGTGLVNILGSVIGTAIFALMCRYSWDTAWSGWLIREYEGVQLQVPIYPVRFLIVFASGLVSLQFFINLLHHINVLRGCRKGIT